MKAFKVLGVALLSVLAGVYLTFLLILPNFVNLNSYQPDIQKAVREASGLEFSTANIKLKTTWDLKAKLAMSGVSIKYPNQKELLSAKKGEAGINLLKLLFLNFQLSDLQFEEPKVYVAIENDGRYDIEKYLNSFFEKQAKKNTENPPSTPQNPPIKISNKMPDIVIKNYSLNLKDKRTGNILSARGEKFKIYDFELGKKIKIVTNGKMLVNNQKHADFQVKIESFLPEMQPQTNEPCSIPKITFNPIPPILKYNFGAKIDTDLKISQKDGEILLKGFMNTDKINYKLQGQNIGGSFLKLVFKGSKIDISSQLFVDKNEKFLIEGLFKNGRKQFIDLQIKSGKIELADIQRVLIALTDVTNLKTDLDKLTITGYLDSDFVVKSDMKKIESSGHLKISNGSITHSQLPLKITAIKSNLDFSNNKIRIKDSSALVNGSLFNATGIIDTNANADLKITADKLPLNLLYEAFAPATTKKNLQLTNGLLSMNVTAKGRLDKVEPDIDLKIIGLKARENTISAGAYANSVLVDLIADQKGNFKGTAKAEGVLVTLDEPYTKLSFPKGELAFDTKNITIKPSTLYLDNSNFTLSGIIKNYSTKPDAEITADGNFTAADGLKYIPRENHSMISTKGIIPIKARIISNGADTKISAQAYANAQNHIAALDINNLTGKPSITNAELELSGNLLKINDLGLYANNISNSSKILSVSGKIGNLSSKIQTLEGIKISTIAPLTAAIPGMKGSSITLKADINAGGTVNAPIIAGKIEIPNIIVPDYKLSGQNIYADFNKSTISVKCPSVNLNGSKLGLDALINTNFGKYTTIHELNINSEYVDVDKLLQLMEIMPQTTVSPGAAVPVIIQKGRANIARLKSGNLILSSASGDFTMKSNILKLNNLRATAYNGVVAGDVTYNVPYETMNATIQGRGLDANPAIMSTAGLKDQIHGKLDFDTKLTLMGTTWKQQMQSLRGYADFSISEGHMGTLGRLEHFIYASNLLSQRFAQSTVNNVIQTLAPKNTGRFRYLKGHLTFANGWAELSPVHSGGPQMSLYITGRYNLLNNFADLEILGRAAREVVSVMGPIGDMSVSKLLGNIPKFGASASNILSTYNAIKDEETLARIPQLVPPMSDTKQFQVIINGDVEKPTSVRTFKWIASESEVRAAKAEIAAQIQSIIPSKVTDYIKIPAITGKAGATAAQNTVQSAVQSAASTAVQSAGNALRDTARQQIQKAVPSFWDKIE